MTARNSIMARVAGDPPGIYLKIPYEPGQSLAQAVYLSGLASPPALCSGIALCARCRLRILGVADSDGEEGPGKGEGDPLKRVALPPSPDPIPLPPQTFYFWEKVAGSGTPPALPEDRQLFSEEELAVGWRLGCRHAPVPGLLVELPLAEKPKSVAHKSGMPQNNLGIEGREHTPSLLAVDLGTTTLAWRLDAEELREVPPAAGNADQPDVTAFGQTMTDGAILAQGSEPNPQLGAGTDVVSRLAVAQSALGKSRLQHLTLHALREIARQAEEDGLSVSALCLAANPVMTALTLGLNTKGLATAPYTLPLEGGNWEQLPGLPPLWVPPQLSPFVGGDVSAGYAAIALSHLLPEARQRAEAAGKPAACPEYPFLLADLGTNGEFLLALSPEEAVCASVALGPALEGIGLSCGMEAGPGAITAFSLSALGLEAFVFCEEGGPAQGGIESGETSCACPACAASTREHSQTRAEQPADPSEAVPPACVTGISGTGYLSLLHALLKARAMDNDGHFTLERSPLLRRSLAGHSNPAQARPTSFPCARSRIPGNSLTLPHGLFLSPADVEEILKVKASFSLGLRLLLEHTGLRSTALSTVFVAGSLGRHVDKDALEALGFFPPGMQSRIKDVGNSSLTGAAMLLKNREMREALLVWKQGVRSLDLASHPAFRAQFPSNMRFVF